VNKQAGLIVVGWKEKAAFLEWGESDKLGGKITIHSAWGRVTELAVRRVLRCFLLASLLLSGAWAGAQAASAASDSSPATSYRPRDPLNEVGFERFYNLDYEHAIQDFERVLQRHPNDPFAMNHLITAVLI